MSIYEYNEEAVMKVIWEQEREYGWEKGREEGIAVMRRLMKRLVESSSPEEIRRAADDEDYTRQLLSEYGL